MMGYLMNKIILAGMVLSLGGCNVAYTEAVKEQLAAGYKWVEIPCRPVNPDVPSVTLDTPDGRKLVCNVLRK
jgi:hypothetical protein